jgi:large subunit ribosomal protein L25
MTISLTAVKRETSKAPKAVRKEGNVPAVVYGPKQEALAVSVPAREFDKVLKSAGESTVIELSGLGEPMQVLIHEVDRDPVTNAPRHIDLYAIEKGAKVEVAVPLVFVGESEAVKAGANLVKVMHELEIEAAPADLPHDIQVDISTLANVGDQIHVSDLKIPAGVTVKVEGDEVVALIQEVQVEEESPIAAPDMASIEVEKKGKTEEEAATAE